MFQFIPVREENIFAFRATGKLTDDDYQQFLPELTTLIHKYGPISLLVELDDFHGWDSKAARDDFDFGKSHDDDFIRIAIVGEKRWQKWMTMIGNIVSDTKIHFFSRDELQNAWDWLREGNEEKEKPEEQEVASGKVELKPYGHILVAVDLLSNSDLAIQRGLELAKFYGASLSLVHVLEQTSFVGSSYDITIPDYNSMEVDQMIFDRSVSHMNEIAAGLNYPDIQHDVLWGTPKSTIVSYALAQKADLIVVGSHGRHGFARLLGSTATGVVHSAKCDVVVVKLPGE